MSTRKPMQPGNDVRPHLNVRPAAAPFFSCERAAPVEMTRIGSLRSVNRPFLTAMLSKAITPVVLRGLNLHLSLTILKGVVTIGAASKAVCKWGSQSMLTLRDSLRSMKPTEREPSKILDRVDSLIDELLNDSDLSSSSLASILMAARESVRDGYHVVLARRTWDAHNDLKLGDRPGESNGHEARLARLTNRGRGRRQPRPLPARRDRRRASNPSAPPQAAPAHSRPPVAGPLLSAFRRSP